MKVLILFSQPWRVGGAETHVAALIQGLAGRDVILAVNEGGDEAKLAQLRRAFPKLEIIRIQARGVNVWRWRRDLHRLRRLLESRRVDVVAAQQRTAGIWAYLLHRHTGIPYTVTMHDPWHRARLKAVYRRIFPVIFAVSGNLAAALRTEFGFAPEQVKIINNGIDFNAFTPQSQAAARRRLALPPGDALILHVSRLSRVKGAVALKIIAALPEILKTRPRAKLLIIGEGPLRDEVERQSGALTARYGDRIMIRDFVDDIAVWYHAADVLVGEGRVAMEALACHRPVVAIRNADFFIGAVRRDNIAYACDVNFDGRDQKATPEALARAVEQAFLLTPAENQAIASYIKTRLSIEAMAENYLRVFRDLQG